MTGHLKGLGGVLVLEPGDPGLPAQVFLDGPDFAIETLDGERHEWARENISVTPFDTCTTELHLDGDRLFFRADDPLVFSDRLTAFLAAPLKRKRERANGTPKDEPAPPTVVEIDLRDGPPEPSTEDPFSPPVEVEPTGRKRRRREHEHDWVRGPAGGGIVRRRCRECGAMSIDDTSFEMRGDPKAVFARRR